jgi:hypothetical protein
VIDPALQDARERGLARDEVRQLVEHARAAEVAGSCVGCESGKQSFPVRVGDIREAWQHDGESTRDVVSL